MAEKARPCGFASSVKHPKFLCPRKLLTNLARTRTTSPNGRANTMRTLRNLAISAKIEANAKSRTAIAKRYGAGLNDESHHLNATSKSIIAANPASAAKVAES